MGSGGQLDGWLEEREEEETMNLKDAAYYVPFEKVNDEFVRQTISLQNMTLRLPFSFDLKIKATIGVDVSSPSGCKVEKLKEESEEKEKQS